MCLRVLTLRTVYALARNHILTVTERSVVHQERYESSYSIALCFGVNARRSTHGMAMGLLFLFASATAAGPCEGPCKNQLNCGSLNRSLSCEELLVVGCSCFGCCWQALDPRSKISSHIPHQALRTSLATRQARLV